MKEINRLRILFCLLTGSFGLLLTVIAISSLPGSAISRSEKLRLNCVSLFPQGWAFFTRDARENKTFVYKKNQTGEWEQVNIPGASFCFFMGLDRSGRAINTEMATILAQVNDSMWIHCDRKVDTYFNDSIIPIHIVKDRCSIPRCAGDLLIQNKPPVPWAWASLSREVIMPSKIVKLHVQAISEEK